jgi:hypothetical protein
MMFEPSEDTPTLIEALELSAFEVSPPIAAFAECWLAMLPQLDVAELQALLAPAIGTARRGDEADRAATVVDWVLGRFAPDFLDELLNPEYAEHVRSVPAETDEATRIRAVSGLIREAAQISQLAADHPQPPAGRMFRKEWFTDEKVEPDLPVRALELFADTLAPVYAFEGDACRAVVSAWSAMWCTIARERGQRGRAVQVAATNALDDADARGCFQTLCVDL